MRAEVILRRVMGELASQIHRARLNAVTAAVVALIEGGKIGLASLGRSIARRSNLKHGIKRVDRLLGNAALFGELQVVYAAIARYVIGSSKRPIILVDWTEAGKATYALTAAVPAQGRAVAIYSLTCPQAKAGSPLMERAFLDTLKQLLPPNCSPIIVTDAGFRGPWIAKVRALGWDFVARVRGSTHVRRVGAAHWQRWKDLFPKSERTPRSLGIYRLARYKSYEARLVTVDERSRRARRPAEHKRRNLRARRGAAGNREPWLLATSLPCAPKEIVDCYARRMQIELTFRDLKSHRFGWGFEDAGCRSPSRIAIQILIAALASMVAMLVGIAAEQAGLRTSFQANTTTHRRVLSWITLGCLVLQSARHLDLPLKYLPDRLPIVGIP